MLFVQTNASKFANYDRN